MLVFTENELVDSYIPRGQSKFTARIASKKLGEGVLDAHKDFIRESPTFFAYWKKENLQKNAKPNEVFLYDWNRVVLSGDSDYYNASYVDGFSKKAQYIMAQAPFDGPTQEDFFRMVAQEKPEAMVVMDAPDSADFKYVFVDNGTYAGLSVSIEKEDGGQGYAVRCITVDNRKVRAYCITGWNTDEKLPKGFLNVHEKIRNAIGSEPKNPVLLVCKDGCARCPFFCLVDVEKERVRLKGRIKFGESIRSLRYQRSNSFDTQELFEAGSAILVDLAKRNVDAAEKNSTAETKTS